MDKRTFLSASLATSVVTLTGCVTEALYKKKTYTERVSAVAIAQDKSRLAVLGPTYHYIFDEPRGLFEVLSSELKGKLSGRFGEFTAERDNTVHGTVDVTLRSTEEADHQKAAALGFTRVSSRDWKFHGALKGKRFSTDGASDFKQAQQLNEKYYVSVIDKGSYGEAAAKALVTPITVAADGVLLIGGIAGAIVLLPLVLPFVLFQLH